MRRIVSLVVALAVLFAVADASLAATLQPGAEIFTTDEQCTLGFAFDGQGSLTGRTYFVTAGHCANHVGEPVSDGMPSGGPGSRFGKIVLIGGTYPSPDDYALIQVDPSQTHYVDPSVAGHPDYPTGYTNSTETTVGDEIQISGWGELFTGSGAFDMRSKRKGVLVDDDPSSYGMDGPVIFGDSGGPLVHIPTGRALGIVSGVCWVRPCYDQGPTVEGIIARAAAHGFPIAIKIVGFGS